MYACTYRSHLYAVVSSLSPECDRVCGVHAGRREGGGEEGEGSMYMFVCACVYRYTETYLPKLY